MNFLQSQLGPPSLEGKRLGRIYIGGLSDRSRSELMSRLQIHVGDTLEADSLAKARAEARAIRRTPELWHRHVSEWRCCPADPDAGKCRIRRGGRHFHSRHSAGGRRDEAHHHRRQRAAGQADLAAPPGLSSARQAGAHLRRGPPFGGHRQGGQRHQPRGDQRPPAVDPLRARSRPEVGLSKDAAQRRTGGSETQIDVNYTLSDEPPVQQ